MSNIMDFEFSPPIVSQKEIKEVISADVIVVGAGIAGLSAAVSAAELGANTILIEKGSGPSFRGIDIAAVNSKCQKEAGIEIDRDEVIAEIMRWSAYWADQRIVTLWADRSGSAVDWLTDMAVDAGISPVPINIKNQTIPGFFYKFYPIGLDLPRKLEDVAYVLQHNAELHGVNIHFDTPAVKLIREKNGRVTGVIAQTSTGYYKQFNASKAVILCTGDYGHNTEMLKKYMAPRTLYFTEIAYGFNKELSRNPKLLKERLTKYSESLDAFSSRKLNTGDGHRMGLWVGAAIDEPPHCAILFDQAVVDSPEPIFVPLTRQPFLNVNLNGERFKNEELPFGYICNADMQQPGHMKWVVWDSKWEKEVNQFGWIGCKAMTSPLHVPSIIPVLIETGIIKSAQTLEDLAKKMQVPVENFTATVTRYNELAKLGKDLDFGKRPQCLTTIEKPPFFAVKMGASLLVTLGGLKVNTKLQVLDTEGKVIPGLYAAGNTSGSFFANDYPITVRGLSHSRALTFGRIAGLNAAREY